jgi:hypothetical protein
MMKREGNKKVGLLERREEKEMPESRNIRKHEGKDKRIRRKQGRKKELKKNEKKRKNEISKE